MTHKVSSLGVALSARASLRLAALPLAVAAAFPVVAQTMPAVPSLSETVVTAARVEQPLSDLVGDVSIVDRATIERSGATGVADVLARLPGIEMTRNGGIGNNTSVYIRGAEHRFTAVYIDGVRVDSQTTGGVSWESIPLAQIDRIEVLRGPAAAVYGSDAIGGVIQLFTKRGDGKPMPYVGVGIGSYKLRRGEAGVSGSAGPDNAFDYSLGVSREVSDGFNVQPLRLRNPVRTGTFGADGYTSPDRDGYDITAANARLGFKINPSQRVELTMLRSDTDSRYDVRSTVRRATYPDDTNANTLRTVGAAWIAKWNDVYSTRLQVTDSRSTYETNPSFYRTETQLRNYLFQNEFRFGPHSATVALERREDELDNAATAFGTRLTGKRSQNALALGYGFVQGPHSIQLHARHDEDSEFGGKSTGSAGYGFVQGPHSIQLHARHDEDSEFGGKTTGSAGYGFAITPQWRATASAGTSFRAPTLYQRFSQYGVAGLSPEEGRNVEVGLRYTEGATNAGIVAYRNRVTNLVTFDSTSFACTDAVATGFGGCYGNTARAEYDGVTLSAGHRIGPVTLRASADFQDPRDLSTGNQLARRARKHGMVGADWDVAGWRLGAEMQTSGMRYDDAANLRKLGGYTVFNLVASTQLTRELSLVARIDNVGDKDYVLARTYATSGRAGYIGLKWAPQ
ncbi:MAG: putative TonB-dependent receptor [Variovorax sp.]|nr:putative TonB-dependent receptor [Variovorax sp.]